MLDGYTTEDSGVEWLIQAQRRLSASPDPVQRVVGSLLMSARLQKLLSVLPDAAIGQLMFEHVWNVMDVFSPELAICQAATERLLNSSSLVKTKKEKLSR